MIGQIDTSRAQIRKEYFLLGFVEIDGPTTKDGPDGTRTNPTPPTHHPEGPKRTQDPEPKHETTQPRPPNRERARTRTTATNFRE